MELRRFVHAVDSHTGGEPTRIILAGGPVLRGKTMMERWKEFREEQEDFRCFISREPRGHGDMVCAFLTPPCREEAHVGVLFVDTAGYLTMCGHGSIGVARTLLDLGMVPVVEPLTEVVLDTPVGLVRLAVEVSGGVTGDVTLSNVPSFVAVRDASVVLPSTGQRVTFDIAFGGNFFAILPGESLGFQVLPEECGRMASLALELRDAINREIPVCHPVERDIDRVELVEFYKEIPEEGLTRNCVVFAEGSVDRSPCGTGTCAKMALLAAEGKLRPGEVFVHQSVTGSVFRGGIQPGPKVGEYDTVLPWVRGRSSVTGFNLLVQQGGDELGSGFLLGRR